MAGEPQRVALSIQCLHSGTVAVPMFLCNDRYAPSPPFCKFFGIMGFAVFSWQISVSKEVICLILLNHAVTLRVFACMSLARPAICSLCWGNDGMIWLGWQGQMSQWGLSKIKREDMLLAWTFKIAARGKLGAPAETCGPT